MDKASLQKIARITGLFYLLVVIVPMLPLVFIDPLLTVDGDSVATVNNIIEKAFLFRLDTTITLMMFIGVVPLSVGLYIILESVNKYLAQTSLFFRLSEAIVGMIAVLGNLMALNYVSGEDYIEKFGSEPYYSLAEWIRGLYWEATILIFVLLALGSVICFFLFFKSGYIPRALSIWGMASYSLVLIGAFISLLFSGNAYLILGAQTILFEIVIGAWLLFKGLSIDGSPNQNPVG